VILLHFEVTVGVDYSSDIHQVIQILKEAVDSQNNVLMVPSVFRFGDSSLNFSVIFWSEELFRIETTKSDLRIKIFELFKKTILPSISAKSCSYQ
jgi:small-conductance mechanosensitive channel